MCCVLLASIRPLGPPPARHVQVAPTQIPRVPRPAPCVLQAPRRALQGPQQRPPVWRAALAPTARRGPPPVPPVPLAPSLLREPQLALPLVPVVRECFPGPPPPHPVRRCVQPAMLVTTTLAIASIVRRVRQVVSVGLALKFVKIIVQLVKVYSLVLALPPLPRMTAVIANQAMPIMVQVCCV